MLYAYGRAAGGRPGRDIRTHITPGPPGERDARQQSEPALCRMQMCVRSWYENAPANITMNKLFQDKHKQTDNIASEVTAKKKEEDKNDAKAKHKLIIFSKHVDNILLFCVRTAWMTYIHNILHVLARNLIRIVVLLQNVSSYLSASRMPSVIIYNTIINPYQFKFKFATYLLIPYFSTWLLQSFLL